jgi:adenosine deaminase
MEQHNIKQLLDMGLCVTVNSDDPSYFGGYVVDNFRAIQSALQLSESDIYQLAKNSFHATFLDSAEKQDRIHELEQFMNQFTAAKTETIER